MTRAVRPSVSLATVLLCVSVTMAVGTIQKAPCAAGNWGDGRQYTWLCYTDIVPLLGTEQLAGSRLPFFDACTTVPGQNCDEYPVLTMYFMRTGAWIAGANYSAFYFVNVALLLVCALAIGAFLYLMAGTRALYFALAPTLLVYGTMNWDLLAVALATGALLLLFRRRDGTSGALLGLGAAAKLYPALLVIPFIAQRLRERRPDGAIALGWAAALTWGAVNVGFFLASPGGWLRFFRFNSERLADFDSLWYIGCRHVDAACVSVRAVNVLSAALFAGSFILVWALRARRFTGFPRWTLGFPMIALFLVTNKVYSPQYGLWLLPWFALALPGLRRFVAFELADVAVFVTRFWWFGRYQGGWGTPQSWFEVAVLLRAAVLLWCVVCWVREQHQPLPIESATAGVAAAAEPEALPA